MLHELLLALFGTTGGLFLDSDMLSSEELPSGNRGGFLVNPKLAGVLNPAELEMLTRIAQLGYQFKLIQAFLRKYGGIGIKLALQMAYQNEGKVVRQQEGNNLSDNGEENE